MTIPALKRSLRVPDGIDIHEGSPSRRAAPKSGRVLWRLGGKRSDLSIGQSARYQWQHDARWQPDGSITVFDDADGPRKEATRSRGLRIDLDHSSRTARLADAYVHPVRLADAMGSVQILPGSGGFVGWGTANGFSAYTKGGELRLDARFPAGGFSYRSYLHTWSAKPADRPSLATASSAGGPTAFASWNGATSVVAWRLNAGPTPSALTAVGSVPSHGFETAIPLTPGRGYISVDALDAAGVVLGTSPPVQVTR